MEIERITAILDQGGWKLILSEIRDIINSKREEVEISNKEVKLLLMEQLQESIQFCPSTNKNKSLLLFPSKLSAQNILKDIIKSAALPLRHATLEDPFDLDHKFCDADDLETSWKKQKFPINL